MQLKPGERLGPYEIVGAVGAGGMGEVYKARDMRLERSVAIKILPAELAQNPQFKQRFEREAKTISQLNHPHICTLHDVGEENGTSYLVMELVDGESLADRVARGPLPISEVLAYGAQIAGALDRAHRAGVTHRDLKPGNVMITKSGAKLLDFGLAKGGAIALNADEATVHKPLTQEGTIVGTFQYMAPEQLEGQEADARTDIFALGAVLYEMATGKRAFEGKTKTSLIAAIVKEHPRPIGELRPLTPPALDHVIAKCLSKDPDDRWQSAHDVAEELKWIGEAGSQAGVATPVTIRRKNRERLAWLIAAITIIGLATTTALLQNARRPPAVFNASIPSVDHNYTFGTCAVISPDGRMFCFTAVAEQGKPRQIWVRGSSESTARPLEGTEGVGDFTWSTDSHSILFRSGGKLKMIEVSGGPPRSIAETEGFGFVMNREGDILGGQGEGGIIRLSAKGGAPRTITTPDKSRHESAHLFPTFLPDGKRFLFVSFGRDPKQREQRQYLYGGSLESKETRLIGEISSAVQYVEPGFLLFVREGALMAVRFDPEKLVMKGDPVTLADGVYYFKAAGTAYFSASQNGVVTYRPPVAAASLVWLDGTGRQAGAPIGPRGDYGGFRISPDGSSVAVSLVDLRIGTSDLWSYSLKRDTSTRLTFDSGTEEEPVFTPDGARMFYGTERAGMPDIFMKVIGSAEDDRIIVNETGFQFPSDVSADGRHLAYSSNRLDGKGDDIWIFPLDGNKKAIPVVRTPFRERGARFSPDGKWIAYESYETGTSQIHIKPFPGPGMPVQVSKRGVRPRWSPDGRKLYFRDYNRMYVADLAALDEEPKLLFERENDLGNFEVSADGQRFLVDVADRIANQPPTRVIVNWPQLLEQGKR